VPVRPIHRSAAGALRSPRVADEQQGVDTTDPYPTTGGQQEPAEPRSWWQRIFGGQRRESG